MLHIYSGVGETAGKPALWGNPPPTRAIVGEPAPNAGYRQGDR